MAKNRNSSAADVSETTEPTITDAQEAADGGASEAAEPVAPVPAPAKSKKKPTLEDECGMFLSLLPGVHVVDAPANVAEFAVAQGYSLTPHDGPLGGQWLEKAANLTADTLCHRGIVRLSTSDDRKQILGAGFSFAGALGSSIFFRKD